MYITTYGLNLIIMIVDGHGYYFFNFENNDYLSLITFCVCHIGKTKHTHLYFNIYTCIYLCIYTTHASNSVRKSDKTT